MPVTTSSSGINLAATSLTGLPPEALKLRQSEHPGESTEDRLKHIHPFELARMGILTQENFPHFEIALLGDIPKHPLRPRNPGIIERLMRPFE